MKTLIIIPAYNEEKNIKRLIERITRDFPEYDYLIINDCSKDSTGEICDKNHFEHIDLCNNLGIGGAVQSGYVYAMKNEYDCAVQLDGDGQHDPMYIEKIIAPIIADEADIVIGSRFIECEGFQSSGMRRIAIRFLSAIIKAVCGERVKDVTSGFRAVNRKYIKLFAQDYADDYPEPEAIVVAKLNGARIIEIPVVMHERSGGISSISPLKSVYYMIKVTLAILFCRITRKKGEIK